MVTPPLPRAVLSVPPFQEYPSASALQSGERFGNRGKAAMHASRADHLTSQGKLISYGEVTYEMFETTIRPLLAGSPMLFCESVITASNKKRLRQFGTRDHSDASNGNGMLRGMAFVSN